MTNIPALLIGESFSPWTKKARWALEYCDIDYDYQEYTPTLSEPGLRWKLKQLTGSVSVPVLFMNGQVFRDSWEIAKHANKVAGDGPLGDMEKIAPWNDLSEAALAEGRTKVVRCILESDAALEESIPTFVPKLVRGKMLFVARDDNTAGENERVSSRLPSPPRDERHSYDAPAIGGPTAVEIERPRSYCSCEASEALPGLKV